MKFKDIERTSVSHLDQSLRDVIHYYEGLCSQNKLAYETWLAHRDFTFVCYNPYLDLIGAWTPTGVLELDKRRYHDFRADILFNSCWLVIGEL